MALLHLGINFATILPDIFWVDDSDITTLALLKVDLAALSRETGTMLLRLAVEKKDFGLAQTLVDHGVELNAWVYGFTTSYQATMYNNFESVSFLLEKGANTENPPYYIDYRVKEAPTPLARAACNKSLDIFIVLIKHNASLDCKIYLKRYKNRVSTRKLEKALYESIKRGSWIPVVALLQCGVGTNPAGMDQPLAVAVSLGSQGNRRDICKIPLKFGADAKVPGLLKEAVQENPDFLQMLIEAGAPIAEQGPEALLTEKKNTTHQFVEI
ncbi:hypothetical protein B0J13DRAFT_519781 [Dactylonectria estremocensis]|uniref:Ankyrin repeat protein n=1 Tax=Dactylonectria estremocensis TaxID=1079267 RepID=A0A9P9JBE0_9HYPO|nr:hypothetical protein B0J13DRAFT_519781 [Dactylonectria estremocensis]